LILNNSAMITKYVVLDSKSELVVEVSSSEEAHQTVMLLKEQNPHLDYSVEEKQVSGVKPGFGRDPDLH